MLTFRPGSRPAPLLHAPGSRLLRDLGSLARSAAPHTASADPSRGLVSRVRPLRKMELSESVQGGLRSLADPSVFDPAGFPALVDASYRSLLASHADPAVLGEPQSLSLSPPPTGCSAFVSVAASGFSRCGAASVLVGFATRRTVFPCFYSGLGSL